MRAVFLLLGVQARSRWRSWLALAAVVGVVGGAVVALLAGARRTETAYPRFLAGTNAWDVFVLNGTTPETYNRMFDFDALARRPEVVEAVTVNVYAVPPGSVVGRIVTPSALTVIADPDDRYGTVVNSHRVLRGRLPEAQNELAVSTGAARLLDVEVDDTLRLQLAGTGSPGAETDFRVVGVVATQAGFPPLTGGMPPPILVSSEYALTHPDSIQALAVRLRDGTAGIAAFEGELQRLSASALIPDANRSDLTSVVQRGVDVQATALRVLAALVGAAALVLLGQALVRQALTHRSDASLLHALGCTSGDLRMLAFARAAGLAVVAAVVACGTAVVLSPLFPVGVARDAELHPGVKVDPGYLAAGAGVVCGVVAILSVAPSWRVQWTLVRSARWVPSAPRPALLSGTLARAGLPVPGVTGIRMALEPSRGRAAVPVRSTIVVTMSAVSLIVGVLGFSASLRHLFDEPRLYGWNWDIQVGDAFAPPLVDEAARVAADPASDAVAVATTARLQIDGIGVDALAIEAVKGTIQPVVVRGRAPTGPSELLLGTRTLRDLDRDVGDLVNVQLGDRATSMVVVGRGVLPEFSGAARLGQGAALTLEGIRTLAPDAPANVVLARVRPGPDGAALLDDLVQAQAGNLYLPAKPWDLEDLDRVGGVPSLVAALLAVMAIATLAHALLTSVGHRRRELAVLKVLGFSRRDVSATIAWQSTAISLIAVVGGVPLGIAAGSWAWRLFATQLGVPAETATPVLTWLTVVPATLLVVNLTAALPARLAARTRPAQTLRSE